MENKENTTTSAEDIRSAEKRAKIAMYNKMASTDDKDSQTIEPHEMTERPIGAPIKEQVRLEKSKLKNMSFKKKVDYIWEYYKLHLIGGSVALALIVSIIIGIFTPSPDTVLFVAWSAGFITEEQREVLVHELEAAVVDESQNEIVDVAVFLTGGDDPMMTMANMQRLVAMVASGHIDIFVLNSETLENYSANGFLQPLEGILAEIEAINPGVFRTIMEYVLYADFEVDTGVYSEQIMGISVSYAPLIAEVNLFYKYDLFFAISSTSQQVENATKALIAFFEPSN